MKTYKAGYQSVPQLLRKKVEFSNFLYFYPRHSQSNPIELNCSRTQSNPFRGLGSTIESNRTHTKKYGQANPIDRLISLLLTFIKIGVRGAEINNRRETTGHTRAWRGIS